MGGFLGIGGFCNVFAVESIALNHDWRDGEEKSIDAYRKHENINGLEKIVEGLGRHGLDLHPLVLPGNGYHLVHVATDHNV